MKSIVAFSLFLSTTAVAQTTNQANIALSWTPPTTRTNGVPLTINELKKFTLYVQSTKTTIDLPPSTTKYTYTKTIDATTPLIDLVAISTTDTNGLESKLSPYAEITYPAYVQPKKCVKWARNAYGKVVCTQYRLL